MSEYHSLKHKLAVIAEAVDFVQINAGRMSRPQLLASIGSLTTQLHETLRALETIIDTVETAK